MDRYDACHKVLLVGNVACGKTSLVTRLRTSTFDARTTSTVGVDFSVATISDTDNKTLRLHLWDSTGHERFRSITTSYYRVAHCVLLCVDTTSEDAIGACDAWLAAVQEYCAPGTPLLLVGTKIDLADERAVDAQALRGVAARAGAQYVETSSATGEGVAEAFAAAVAAIAKAEAKRKTLRRALSNPSPATACCLPWFSLSYWLCGAVTGGTSDASGGVPPLCRV